MMNRPKKVSAAKRRSSSLHSNPEQQQVHQESGVEQIIEICKKPVLFRKPHETRLLINSFRNIKFFKEQFNEHYEGMLEDVAENAKLHVYSKNETIIKQDTYGDTFYIIIKGQVKVVKRVVTNIGSYITKKGKKRDKYHEQIKEIMTLNDGDYFGELALLERKPRGADVISVTDSFILGLDKDSFDRIMATKTKRQFLHLLDTLSCNSILKEISKNTVKALFMIMERKVYNYGDIIYKYGEKGSSLYFIIEGEFKMLSNIYKKEEKDDSHEINCLERESEICILGKNESIGLEEFLDEERRQWKAICSSQVGIVYKLNRIDYKRIEQRYPDIVDAIQKIRDEKKKYYNTWKEKHANPLEAGQQKQFQGDDNQKFDYQKYVERAKQLKQIIMNDKEMQFISRDQVTINDDMDIMLRYCPYFQLGEKKATPFLVNTIETIQQRRVKSANYRPLSSVNQASQGAIQQHNRPSTGRILTQQKEDITKANAAESQPTITINQYLTTQPEDNKQKSLHNSKGFMVTSTPTQEQESKKITIKKKARNYNDVIQNKIIFFMKLTPQKIEQMAIQQRIDKEEFKDKKLYITNYPSRTTGQMLTRIKSAVKLQPQNNSSYRSQQGQIRRGIASSVNLLSSVESIQGGECSRIHSTKNSTGINLDSSALPLKYQADMIGRQFLQRNKQATPSSAFKGFTRQKFKQLSTEY
ncbi:unnamed protein product [Paramecium octaurelia]|uniref:Cyclic nucleotide-binding domain-containing protein n=1 Tax=Paramecium octaurelia TaxID=43137 RepID=A0A8S1TXU6_PAROT|nr:unnamed protein product [Paramecium octaurelia]